MFRLQFQVIIVLGDIRHNYADFNKFQILGFEP